MSASRRKTAHAMAVTPFFLTPAPEIEGSHQQSVYGAFADVHANEKCPGQSVNS
jgi:hypothetical protein